MNLDIMKHEAENIIDELEEEKKGQQQIKDRVRKYAEKVEMVKSDLQQTKEYEAGKNAEIRSAWLNKQKVECPEYVCALAELECEQRLSDTTSIEIETLEKEYRLVMAEIELSSATLRFLAN
jgi:archaellum component FlaC